MKRHELTLKVLCAVCGRPMTFVRTLGGSIADDVNVFQCVPCGFSITQSRTPLMKRDKTENRSGGTDRNGRLQAFVKSLQQTGRRRVVIS